MHLCTKHSSSGCKFVAIVKTQRQHQKLANCFRVCVDVISSVNQTLKVRIVVLDTTMSPCARRILTKTKRSLKIKLRIPNTNGKSDKQPQ